MRRGTRADLLLLIAAAIWGFAFVAQRAGMEHMGPLLFNALRFGLGAAALLPLVWLVERPRPYRRRALLGGGLLAGSVLFAGASCQQMGIVTTTAGKAGFITGLYVIFVPLFALGWGRRATAMQWSGALLAVAGLYFLSLRGRTSIARGDLLVLSGAAFWAVHVHLIAWLTRLVPPVRLAAAQFVVCAVLSLAGAMLTEPFGGLRAAALPLLYSGLLSVSVAFTLQVVAQRDVHPAHAAILLSLEAVFALVGGLLFLHEELTARAAAGCALMLGGMLLAQIKRR